MIVVLLVAAAVAALPLLIRPSPGANVTEIDRLRAEYWQVADKVAHMDVDPAMRASPAFDDAFSRQRKLRKDLHALGHHIDDGDGGCEWAGYVGAWKLLLTRFGA